MHQQTILGFGPQNTIFISSVELNVVIADVLVESFVIVVIVVFVGKAELAEIAVVVV